jgi:hypothetical protein
MLSPGFHVSIRLILENSYRDLPFAATSGIPRPCIMEADISKQPPRNPPGLYSRGSIDNCSPKCFTYVAVVDALAVLVLPISVVSVGRIVILEIAGHGCLLVVRNAKDIGETWVIQSASSQFLPTMTTLTASGAEIAPVWMSSWIEDGTFWVVNGFARIYLEENQSCHVLISLLMAVKVKITLVPPTLVRYGQELGCVGEKTVPLPSLFGRQPLGAPSLVKPPTPVSPLATKIEVP